MDRNEMSNLYRGPSIDASYQVSVHMAQWFQRKFLKTDQSETRILICTFCDLIFLVFNSTFSNISAISCRPVLVVEKVGEIHRPWASNGKLYHLWL
jgi:hypothetical protein